MKKMRRVLAGLCALMLIGVMTLGIAPTIAWALEAPPLVIHYNIIAPARRFTATITLYDNGVEVGRDVRESSGLSTSMSTGHTGRLGDFSHMRLSVYSNDFDLSSEMIPVTPDRETNPKDGSTVYVFHFSWDATAASAEPAAASASTEQVPISFYFSISTTDNFFWNEGYIGVSGATINIYRDGVQIAAVISEPSPILLNDVLTYVDGFAEYDIMDDLEATYTARLVLADGYSFDDSPINLTLYQDGTKLEYLDSWFSTHHWLVTPITETLNTSSIVILIDGALLDMDVAPIIRDDRTLVPVRAIAETLGAEVDWNNDTREVTISDGSQTVILAIDSTTALVDGGEIGLDVAPIIIDGRTMLPIRFLAETFGLDVDWDNDTRTVIITTTD